MIKKQHDYIPSNDGEFNAWFSNLVNYVVQKTSATLPAWNHIPQQDVDELDATYSDWNAAYKPTLQPHTPAQTTAKHDARRRAEKVIRPFVQRYLHWPPVTDADHVNMAIPNHDVTAHKVGQARKRPRSRGGYLGAQEVALPPARPTGSSQTTSKTWSLSGQS